MSYISHLRKSTIYPPDALHSENFFTQIKAVVNDGKALTCIRRYNFVHLIRPSKQAWHFSDVLRGSHITLALFTGSCKYLLSRTTSHTEQTAQCCAYRHSSFQVANFRHESCLASVNAARGCMYVARHASCVIDTDAIPSCQQRAALITYRRIFAHLDALSYQN